jgi:hypothetical protein
MLVLWSIFNFFHSSPRNNINMKYAAVENVMASFQHPILPTVEGDPDYQAIHTIQNLLQAKVRAIDTHLGGGGVGTPGPCYI